MALNIPAHSIYCHARRIELTNVLYQYYLLKNHNNNQVILFPFQCQFYQQHPLLLEFVARMGDNYIPHTLIFWFLDIGNCFLKHIPNSLPNLLFVPTVQTDLGSNRCSFFLNFKSRKKLSINNLITIYPMKNVNKWSFDIQLIISNYELLITNRWLVWYLFWLKNEIHRNRNLNKKLLISQTID